MAKCKACGRPEPLCECVEVPERFDWDELTEPARARLEAAVRKGEVFGIVDEEQDGCIAYAVSKQQAKAIVQALKIRAALRLAGI